MPMHISHAVFSLVAMPACACVRVHARQRMTLAGNDAGSSTFLSSSCRFFIQHLLHIYIDCRVFDSGQLYTL